MEKIRLSTFNMHHGKVDLVPYTHQAMVSSIAELDSDIVCLQETDVYSLRTRFVHQPRLIAKKLGYFYKSQNIRFFKAGFQHNAILSKYPILSSETLLLPKEIGKQVRKAMSVEVKIGELSLKILTTHLHAIKGIENHNQLGIDQLNFVYDYASKNSVDIVAGDLNLLEKDVVPISKKYDFVAPSGFPTSPAKNPQYQIDWIASNNFDLENLEVSSMLTSDHRALSAEILLDS